MPGEKSLHFVCFIGWQELCSFLISTKINDNYLKCESNKTVLTKREPILMNLTNISEVQTGLVLVRKRTDAVDKDTHKYGMLTLKSFEPHGVLNERELDVFFSKEKLEQKYLTNKGDIIVRLTTPYTAICINDKQEGLVIPSNFAIIRLKEQTYIPEFVALFLNSEIIEKKFFKSSISTTIL